MRNEATKQALSAIAEMLWGMENRSGMYAHEPEALEASVVLCVEMRQMLLRPIAYAGNKREVLDALGRFTAEINGEPISCPLFVVLRRAGMLAEQPRLLGDFARWVSRDWPEELA